MLTEVCQEVNNWFDVEKRFDVFTVENGHIEIDGLQDGQYFRIIGSVFNDGVHLSTDTLTDETFDGAVWLLAIPESFVNMVSDIKNWQNNYGEAVKSPYSSESFGGYSYSKSGGGSSGSSSGWKGAFSSDLNRWRKA